jgi:putative MATE family efflux protein
MMQKAELNLEQAGSEALDRVRPIVERDWPLWRMVLTLAVPWWIQHFLNLAVTISDAFLAGHYLDVAPEANITSQSAQTTANYLMWFISNFASLVSVGATALVARFWGARDHAGGVRAMHQALLLAAAFGLAGSLLGLLFIPDLMRLLQPHEEAARQAADYLRPIFLLLTLQMIELVGLACLMGAGDTVSGMWVMSGVAVVNLPLAWVFCRGWWIVPSLGFVGIATGTAVSHGLGCVAVLVLLICGRCGLQLSRSLLRPNFELMRRLLRISIPAGVDNLIIAAAQLWFLAIVNRLDEASSAAHGIALRWEGLGYLTGNAFSVAAMTLVGQYLGARRPDQAMQSGWTALALGGTAMCAMGMVFFLLAEPMFALFCPREEQRPIIEAGVPVLRLVAFAMPAAAACFILVGALRGAGDTRVPILFTLVGFFLVRIPLAHSLTDALSWGLLGAWWAMFADLLVRGTAFTWRFASGKWKWQRV